MKSTSPKRRVRPLRAKASAINPAEFEDYGPEPNMKLSHAFMVVLALHIVAVGGLFAFNKVKANHLSLAAKTKTEHLAAKETAVPAVASTAAVPLPPQHAPEPVNVVHQQAPVGNGAVPPSPVNNIPSGQPQLPSTPPAAPVVAAAPNSASNTRTREYTIAKGDNPYNLAKRFRVSYDTLMKMNNITDPRKIQIGQKLQIPEPTVIPHAPKKKVHLPGKKHH